MSVASVPVLLLELVSPPPDTTAVLVSDDGALAETFTINVSAGQEELGDRVSERVHGPAGCVQAHPLPAILTADIPEGTVSETVTWPVLAPVPTFFTMMLYCAPR